MKHFMISLVAMLIFSAGAIGKTVNKQATTLKDTITVVSNDSTADEDYKTISSDDLQDLRDLDHLGSNLDGISKLKSLGGVVATISIIMIFGMPIFIILIALYFQNKNKQAKYRLVEKALENGKEVPEGLFSKKEENLSIQAKGIKNIFLGLGLGIFLWALTGEFGLGCIGFMVMFTGIGQVIIYRTHNTSNLSQTKKSDCLEKENTSKESEDK